MDATKWKIDGSTELYSGPEGFRIWWCGAFFGPTKTLEELVEKDLLETCRELLKTTGEPVELADCDVGPFGDSITVLLTGEHVDG